MAQSQNEPMKCGAKTRNGGTCQRWPLVGKKRCKLHGGTNPGPPKGNANAVKTGEHQFQTIFDSLFTGAEKEIWDSIDTGKEHQLRSEIKLLAIREHRMMERIHDLKKSDFTVVEITEEDGEAYDRRDGIVLPVHKHTEKRAGTLGQIQAIEDALTRVQNSKAKAIELLIKLEEEHPPGVGDTVKAFLDALGGKVADVWADEPEEEA